MSRLQSILSSLRSQPLYVLMRIAARFSSVQVFVTATRKATLWNRQNALLFSCNSAKHHSHFSDLAVEPFVLALRADGIAHGLRLAPQAVSEILEWTDGRTCYADREGELGFKLDQKKQAEIKLGKPILIAQYFNTTTECDEIRRLASDPVLLEIAARYLDSPPRFVGANLWWTFPVQATEADRIKHAHLFHRDVDDFRFIKFFFYLTDVEPYDGAHVCVAGSHRKPPKIKALDQWNLRRFTDAEISDFYPQNKIQEIIGPAGTGFGEDTLCIHKGSTPTARPRLLLQLQFALFDYGAMHDRRDQAKLSNMV